jgi:hypothetical protein
MFRNLILYILLIALFSGCALKQLQQSKSAIIVFQTPIFKFYDKGFVNIYKDHINLQVFEIGNLVLDLDVYEDKVCQSTLECLSAKEFNKQYLHHSYEEDFLYKLLSGKKIYHKDKENGIFIKVK